MENMSLPDGTRSTETNTIEEFKREFREKIMPLLKKPAHKRNHEQG